jgi:hypothetical protein
MQMEKEAKLVELRDRTGGLIFSLFIVEKSLQEAINEMKGKKQEPTGRENEKPKNSEAFMTDAQKRYLFRILADQGKEGEEAHEYLKNKIFQVGSLKEVTKLEASQAIERLLAESKGGAAK